MGNYILALDQGTTSSRAILFDREQNIVGKRSRGRGCSPAPGVRRKHKKRCRAAKLNTALKKSMRTHDIPPHARLVKRGANGYNRPVVQSMIAVLSAVSTRTGPWGARNTPRPAAIYVSDFHFNR